MGPMVCGGQKDNSNTHIIIKVVTGFVQVIHREKDKKREVGREGDKEGGREEGRDGGREGQHRHTNSFTFH